MHEDIIAQTRERINEKWKCFRECSTKKRRKLRDHEFTFFVEYDGSMEDAFVFMLDGVEVDKIGLGYAGPRSDDFVRIVTTMKERDFQEVSYLYEPGEACLYFSRRNESIYIELPHMEDGFFLRYDYFVERILEGC